MIFAKATQDAGCEKLAKDGTGLVNALMQGLMGTGTEELNAISDETIHCNECIVSMVLAERARDMEIY